MHPTFRAARRFAFLAPLLFAVSVPAVAAPPKPQEPWLYRGSDIPRDPQWEFGELPNGLRYALRNNGVPPGQVSVRIVMDVGSLYERDSERGHAHLLEHLVFRQSKFLGEAQAIPTWQRLGATFGSDTNAETSPTQTVYKLDLPNATPVKFDESLKLLSGMMAYPTLSEANVRTEVPIVLAEKRERGGPGERVADASRQLLYAGQPLANRAPIGTVETLEAANQASVRAFHARWYRPERAIVVIAGDLNTAVMREAVGKWFGPWKVKGKPEPQPSFGDPVAPAGNTGMVGETKVLVEPDLPRTLNTTILRPWRQVTDNIAYNQGLMTDQLAQSIINRRLEARARAGGSYLLATVRQDDVSRSVDETSISITPLTSDWRKALADVRGVIEDAKATAPTQDEIDREVAGMNVAFESSLEQRVLQPSSKLADDITRAVDIRETVASPETVLSIFRKTIPLFTPEAVLRHTRQLFTGTVERAVYLTPQIGEADDAAVRAALLERVAPDPKARLSTKPVSFAELPPIGAPGSFGAITKIGLFRANDIEQVDFGNGVKVLLWPTEDEPGRATVKVRFGAGFRAFESGDAPYIALGDMALVGSGVGTLGQEELDRISTGRKMGFEFGIDDGTFRFSAETRPVDIEDQLYLFAAKFAMPRWDANPVIRAKAAAKLQYESYETSPQGVLERDFGFLQRNRDPRYRTPTPRELDAATPEGFRQVWAPILASGPIEVQVFGDFDRARVLAKLRETFGALPKRPPLPASTRPPVGEALSPSPTPVVLTHRGDANQAAAAVSWPTGGGQANIRESRRIQILAEIFTNRLMDAQREKQGASYAPQVFAQWPVDLTGGGALTALAQMTPDAVPGFFATVEQIAADLAARPITADEIVRVTEPLRQQLARANSSSTFFMNQLEGATADPSRIAAVRTLTPDLTEVTSAELQTLAAQYFGPGKSAQIAIIPQGQVLVTQARVPARNPAGLAPKRPTPGEMPAGR
jgi:zinc protease